MIRTEADLTGIDIIDTETSWIIQAAEEVQTQASRMLVQGIEAQV